MSGTPRMRTLPECIRELQALDPNTALTLTALRRMVKQGKIPVVEIASKRLINLDLLLDMLSNPQQENKPVSGIIRPVPERIGKQWTGT